MDRSRGRRGCRRRGRRGVEQEEVGFVAASACFVAVFRRVTMRAGGLVYLVKDAHVVEKSAVHSYDTV